MTKHETPTKQTKTLATKTETFNANYFIADRLNLECLNENLIFEASLNTLTAQPHTSEQEQEQNTNIEQALTLEDTLINLNETEAHFNTIEHIMNTNAHNTFEQLKTVNSESDYTSLFRGLSSYMPSISLSDNLKDLDHHKALPDLTDVIISEQTRIHQMQTSSSAECKLR